MRANGQGNTVRLAVARTFYSPFRSVSNTCSIYAASRSNCHVSLLLATKNENDDHEPISTMEHMSVTNTRNRIGHCSIIEERSKKNSFNLAGMVSVIRTAKLEQ